MRSASTRPTIGSTDAASCIASLTPARWYAGVAHVFRAGRRVFHDAGAGVAVAGGTAHASGANDSWPPSGSSPSRSVGTPGSPSRSNPSSAEGSAGTPSGAAPGACNHPSSSPRRMRSESSPHDSLRLFGGFLASPAAPGRPAAPGAPGAPLPPLALSPAL